MALALALSGSSAIALPAFPGAEGFGAETPGGRGGAVIKVTTLEATGPGSLQEALDAPGPRIIVFDVSGVIDGTITISHGDVTIAGQTAPGAGITLSGQLLFDYDGETNDVIIRHLRVRPPAGTAVPGEQYDAIQGGATTTRVVLDHISVCCGVDEVVDLYTASDATVSWSTIEEGATEGHPEGLHNYGLINGPDGIRFAVHHTLFVSNQNRNPAIANGPAEVRNNVVYNVRHGFVHHNPAAGEFNIVGNYYKQGPEDTLLPFYFDDEDTSVPQPSYFLSDNYVDDPGELEGVVENPWQEPYFEDLYLDESHRSATVFDFSGIAGYLPITSEASTATFDNVLTRAGAFPRDSVTTRLVAETMSREGSWGAKLPADLLEGLTPATPPTDSDGDGMPDAWEEMQALDPNDGADHATVMPSGYTAIEDYINCLADGFVGGSAACGGSGNAGGAGGGGGSGPAGGAGGGGGSGPTGGGGPCAGGSPGGGSDSGGTQTAAAGASSGGTGSPSASDDDTGGCGCRLPVASRRDSGLLVLAAVGLLARRRRRA